MTMLEKIARAIDAELEGPVNNQDFSRQMRQWEHSKRLAIAAVKAMREPTDEMLDAADAVGHECLQWSLEPGEGLDGIDFEPAWQAVLDSILATQPQDQER